MQDKSEVSVVDASIWVTLWSTVAITDTEVISKEFANIDKWLKHIQGLPTIQKSLKKVKLERGIPAIVAMSASSWFPLNSYTGPGKSSGASVSGVRLISCTQSFHCFFIMTSLKNYYFR